MGVPKRLTEMQKRFAEYLIFGGPEGPVNKMEAAILAGYSTKRAMVEGSELTNPRHCPLVVQYMEKLREEKLTKFSVTYDSHISELARIKDLALKKNSFSAAVNAETNRGKAGGLYMFSGGTGITYNSSSGAFTTTDGDIVHDNLSGFVANEHIDHSSVSVIAGKGLTGGGTIASNRTIDVDSANLVTLARTAISGTNGISYTSGTGVIRAAQPLDSAATPTFNQLRGPSTFIIDPAAIGDSTGTVRILGNLTVEGATTTINSSTISIDDKNIQIADSATDSAGLDGGGITWGGAAIANSPTFNYSHGSARFTANREINATLFSGSGASLTSLPAGQLTGTIDSARIPPLEIADITDITSINHDTLTGFVADEHIAHSGVSIIAGKGLSGGGTIASSRTINIDSANVKGMISVTDAGGDGSLAYNNSTGVLTYTGPSASEVRAHISGNKGLTYNSTSGVMDVDSANIKAMFSGDNGITYDSGGSGKIRIDSAELISLYNSSLVHDNLSGFVANEHIDHSAVSISTGTGLSGGGTIASTRTLKIDSADLAGLYSKVIVHDNTSGFVADEHVAHAGVSIIAGKGLSGGGTIASSRTIDVDSANLVTMSRAAISVTGEGSYNSTTGVITLPTLGTHYLDSAIALSLIDANALDSGRGLALIDANALDSGRAIGLIDSAYVQIRQTTAAGDGGIAMAIALG